MNNEIETETRSADAGAKAASNLFRDEFVTTIKAQGDAIATGDAIKVPPYSSTERPPTDAKPNFANQQPPTDTKPSISDMTQRPLDSGLSDLRSAIVREQTLPTGDSMTENILSGEKAVKTKSGDRVTIDRDGNVKVDGAVKGVAVDKDGRQTYTMADGAVIVVGKDGFESVTRDKHTVSFHRLSRTPLNSYPR